MRTKKVFGFFTAAVMAVASLPILSVGAADSTVLLGDVDQDGVITGHDSAMVSRYLNVDSTMFTEEQLKLADINEDDVVDQTDADLIHEKEVFCIGEFVKSGAVDVEAALNALYCISYENAGAPLKVVKKDIPIRVEVRGSLLRMGEEIFINGELVDPVKDAEKYQSLYSGLSWTADSGEISELDYNLMDANGDGVITIQDAANLLYSYCATMAASAHGERVYYFSEGRYDLYDGFFNSQKFEENAKL